MCNGSDNSGASSSSSSDDSSSSSTYGMSPGQAQAMGQGYEGGDTVGSPSGASSDGSTGGNDGQVYTYDFGDDDDDYSDPNAGMSMADQYASYGQGNQGITATTTDSGLSDYEQAAFGTTQEDFYSDQGTTDTDTDTDSGSTYDEIPTAAQINAASGFTDDDEDYTPTKAELDAAIAAAGGVNLTDPEYAETVDFTTTGSGNDFTTTAQADTAVSGAEYVANTDPVTGENTTDTLFTDELLPPPPVDDTPAPVYTDSAGVQHPTQAAADAADAQYAESARLENERIEAEAEAERIQALINQVVAQDSAETVTAAPVEDSDLGAALEAAEKFDAYTKGLNIPDDAPITYDGNQQLGASGGLDDSRFDFVDDLPDDRFDFVDETEALLAELGITDVDLLGDNTTDSGINLESSRYDFVDDLPDDANDFVETPVTNLDKVQDLVDSGVDRTLAQSVVESGGTIGEPAGIDKYDFGFDGGIKGSETAPSVLTNLALGDGTDPYAGDIVTNNVSTTDDANPNFTVGGIESQNLIEEEIAALSGSSDGLTDYEREVFGTDTATYYNDLADVGTTDTSGATVTSDGTTVPTSGTTDKTGTELYLSAIDKISAEGYDPDAKGNLTEPEQRALYGARGQTPNAAETSYLEFLLSDATHNEDGEIDNRRTITSPTTYGSTFNSETGEFEGSNEKTGGGETIDNPNFGKPTHKAGDKVTVQSFGEKVEDGIVSFIDMFLNPLSIFGEKFTIGGANKAYVEKQLEAYKNGGTFVYGDDGKTVVGVASPNFDASGDGNNDTVVLFDGDGNKTVTGDGIGKSDITTSNSNKDGEEFDIDIVTSTKTYTNTKDGVVVGTRGDDEEQEGGDDDDFIICEEGFEFDPKEGICMPIAGVGTGGGTDSGSPIFKPRPIKGPTIPPPVGGPAMPPPKGLIIRKPAQFAQGGMVTSNIDNFVQSLRG